MGKIDLTTGASSSVSKEGHLSLLNSEEARKARYEAVLKEKHLKEAVAAQEEPAASSVSFQENAHPDTETPKKPVIGGEIKDPVKQNLIATISAQEEEIASLEEELKREKEKNVVSLEKISELNLKINELEKKVIILERPSQLIAEPSKLRPVGKAAPRLAGTTTRPEAAESPKQEPVTAQTKTSTMRSPAVARLPKRNMVAATPVVVEQAEAANDEKETTKDFLHEDKTGDALKEAVMVVHDTTEEPNQKEKSVDEVEVIEKAIEAEPFLPPEKVELTVEEKMDNTTSMVDKAVESSPEPTPIVLDESGSIEYLPKKSNVEKLAGVSSLVEAVFKDPANDPVFLAWSATGKKAA